MDINISLKQQLKQVSQITNLSDLQQYFDEVASYLFHHVGIIAGKDIFTFVEVEFYYYKKGVFNGRLFNCTYPRSRSAGQFFWHYSGIDICFDSDEEKEIFGGILIRSLMKNGKEIIAGPMRCSDEIMNSCVNELPRLDESLNNPCEELKQTIRFGIAADKEQSGQRLQFCYYVKPNTWKRKRTNVLVADKQNGGYHSVSKTDYYSAQPENR